MRCEVGYLTDKGDFVSGLNPCFSGICAARKSNILEELVQIRSLNPCFSGICAASVSESALTKSNILPS